MSELFDKPAGKKEPAKKTTKIKLPKTLKGRVLSRMDKEVAVEYFKKGDRPKAYIMPTADIVDWPENFAFANFTEKTLADAKPYGIDWESLIELKEVTADDIADQLRRRSIYTTADFEKAGVGTIAQIIMSVHFLNAQKLSDKVREYKEND